MNRTFLQAVLCVGLATILALAAHIYMSEWLNPILDSMAQDLNMNPASSTYSSLIVTTAYITAFTSIGFLAFFYYHAQHLIPGNNKVLKTVLVTGMIFAVKGEPIRQPIMNLILNLNIGLEHPFIYVALQNLDKWIATFLMAFCLVYLCPKKSGSPA